jgi:polysaccharide deacetylase
VVLLSQPLAVVHVDLDGGPEIFAAHGWSYPRSTDPLFLSGLRGTIDLLDELGLKATLFVIVDAMKDAERRALVLDAVSRGHRIASHTLTHRWLPTLAAPEQQREIAESKARLEQLFGAQVQGFRAPGFGTSAAIRGMVAEAGYVFDSSQFPPSRDRSEPWREPTGLVELPLPAHRPLPWPFHPSYSLVLGSWYFRVGVTGYRGTGAPLVFLIHLTDLADPLPPDYLTGWKSRIFTLSHLGAGTKRERCRAMLAEVGRRYRWAASDDELIERAEPGTARGGSAE